MSQENDISVDDSIPPPRFMGFIRNRLNIGAKLSIGFGILIFLMMIGGVLGVISSRQTTDEINRTAEVRAPAALTSARAQADLLEMMAALQAYLALGDQAYRDQYEEARLSFEENLAELQIISEEEDLVYGREVYMRDQVAVLNRVYYDQWLLIPEQLFELRDDQLKREPALRILLEEGNPLIVPIVANTSAVIEAQKGREPSAENMELLGDMASFQTSFFAMVAGLRGYVTTGRDSFKFEYSTNQAINDEAWENLIENREQMLASQQTNLDDLGDAREAFLLLPEEMFRAVEGEHAREDFYLFRTQAVQHANAMLALLDEETTDQQELLQNDLDTGRAQLAAFQRVTAVSSLFILVVALTLAFAIREDITGPIRRLTNTAEQIREGDLEVQAVVESRDEIGELALTFNRMTLQQRRTLLETEEAREVAEEATKAKSDFLASMSHELRTPLNAIIGFTRIVQRKTRDMIPQKQSDNLAKVLSSAEHLLGLINTILDIAKIESGRLDVIVTRFHVGSLIETTVVTAQPLLQPDVVLNTEIAPDLPPLESDQDKIKQILLNLLSNAAKFTHEGTITVYAHPDKDMLAIDVVDSGIGISAEALERIFEEFQQADELTHKEYGGTGLGLSISKQLAQLLGGDLTAVSQVGSGSTFTLSLPWSIGSKTLEQVVGVNR